MIKRILCIAGLSIVLMNNCIAESVQYFGATNQNSQDSQYSNKTQNDSQQTNTVSDYNASQKTACQSEATKLGIDSSNDACNLSGNNNFSMS